MRTRRNPSTSTMLLIGGGLLAVGLALHANATSATPSGPSTTLVEPQPPPIGSTPAPQTITVPTNINSQMINIWKANGSPMDQATWVQVVSPLIPQMTGRQWALVYQQVYGFHHNGGWANDQTVYNWVVQAAAT